MAITHWGGTYNNNPNLPGFSWNDDHNTSHETDNDNLTSTEDTATKLWGSNWRMPTTAELEALIDFGICDEEWINGTTEKYNDTTVPGILCKGKGVYASNIVFLPAAGYCDNGNVSGQDDYCYYWSSKPNGEYAYCLYTNPYKHVEIYYRNYGHSVRAVLK